jgi:tetratricopeptide (TPR) repeat protein
MLARGDPPRVYLDRAHALRPADPEVTYLLGIQSYKDGDHAAAWRYWRETLEQSDRHFEEVVTRSARVLPTEGLVEEVLPRRPQALYRAAFLLFPGEEDGPRRRVFLEPAVPLFKGLPGPLSAEDLHLKARIHDMLDQPVEATAAYQAALAREPRRAEWRLEAARLLQRQGRLREAEDELRQLLRDHPGYGGAVELLKQVMREKAKGK